MLCRGCGPDHFSLPNTVIYSSWNQSISPVALLRSGLPIRASLLGPNNCHYALLRWRCLFDWGVDGTTDASGFSTGKHNSILGSPYCSTHFSCGRNIFAHSGKAGTVIVTPIYTEWLGGIAVACGVIRLSACSNG
jgi:hypothetical protein